MHLFDNDTVNVFKDYVMPVLNSLTVLIIVFVANKLNNKADQEDITDLKKDIQQTNDHLLRLTTLVNTHISKADVRELMKSLVDMNNQKRTASEFEKDFIGLLLQVKGEIRELNTVVSKKNEKAIMSNVDLIYEKD